MCGSDETHPYPVRSFTYRTEQATAKRGTKGDRVHYVLYAVCIQTSASALCDTKRYRLGRACDVLYRGIRSRVSQCSSPSCFTTLFYTQQTPMQKERLQFRVP